MDYTTQSFLFKVRKAARYVRLYGPSRTLEKIRGQYHMRSSQPPGSVVSRQSDGRGEIGIIGAGNFAFSTIAYYVRKEFGPVLRGVMDVDGARAASLAHRYGASYATTDPERLLTDSSIRTIFVASNHASHAEYAIAALKAGKVVHIEKPHVVTLDQLERLAATIAESEGRIRLGFNRPNSRLGRIVRSALANESGPGMYNWFIAGHAIDPDHWYFSPREGGRVLGNLCHWTDFILQLVPETSAFPIRIIPAQASRSDCDIAISYVFGDDTVGAITFSAKGHTFEGVRERFSAHKGNTLASIEDFQTAVIERGAEKRRYRNLFRDHGHREAIVASVELGRGESSLAAPVRYLWNTGALFLATRRALEDDRMILLDSNERGFAIPNWEEHA